MGFFAYGEIGFPSKRCSQASRLRRMADSGILPQGSGVDKDKRVSRHQKGVEMVSGVPIGGERRKKRTFEKGGFCRSGRGRLNLQRYRAKRRERVEYNIVKYNRVISILSEILDVLEFILNFSAPFLPVVFSFFFFLFFSPLLFNEKSR